VKKTQGRHGSGHPWTFATRAAGRTVGERREEKRERCSRCPNSSRIGRRSSRVQTMQVSGGGACAPICGGATCSR
jgi:ribosomal protein S8E